MTPEKTSEITLADQALETYDRQGETAMLSFIMKNLADRDRDRESLWNGGVFMLHDRSFVALSRRKEGAIFITNREGKEHTRPAAIDPSSLPPYPDILPMLHWPNSDSIRDMLLEKIEVMARERAGLEPTFGETTLEASTAVITAPALDQAVRAAIEQFNQEENTYSTRFIDTLDQHGEDCAENALKRIPEEQLEALVRETARMIGPNG